jgi:hypothetical protein
MSDNQISLQTESAHESHRLESPREFIRRLQAEFPDNTPEQICERYLSHIRGAVEIEDDQDRLYVMGPLSEWLRANVIPVEKKPRRKRPETAAIVEQIEKADQERIEQIAGLRLLEYLTTYGKTLGDCTGAECQRLGRQYGGFFAEVATRLTPGQHVRNHLSELELQGIALAHRLIPA